MWLLSESYNTLLQTGVAGTLTLPGATLTAVLTAVAADTTTFSTAGGNLTRREGEPDDDHHQQCGREQEGPNVPVHDDLLRVGFQPQKVAQEHHEGQHEPERQCLLDGVGLDLRRVQHARDEQLHRLGARGGRGRLDRDNPRGKLRALVRDPDADCVAGREDDEGVLEDQVHGPDVRGPGGRDRGEGRGQDFLGLRRDQNEEGQQLGEGLVPRGQGFCATP